MTTTNQLRSLISDDAFAMQFQSMGQYRNALLKSIDQAGRSEAQGEPCKEFGLPLDFSKPLETIDGRPVEYVGNGVIEYECARVCVDQDTGVVYSSPYHGLRIRNVKSAGSAEQVSERELASMLVAFANDDSIPKLDDDEIRAICQSRGWTPTDTPSLRELAHVFYAEGCAAQRRALQHTAPAPNDQAEEDAAVIYKLGSVLAEIAIALKGEELPLHRHSYHDLADLVRIKVLECDLLKMQVEELKEAAPSKAGEWTDERIEQAAQLLWDRFAPSHNVEWSEEPYKAEYRDAARALLSAPAQAQSEDARDAARYRWLRARHVDAGMVECPEIKVKPAGKAYKPIGGFGVSLDEQIDHELSRVAAMSTTPSEKEPK